MSTASPVIARHSLKMSNPPYAPFSKGGFRGIFIRTYVEYSKFKVQKPFGHWDFGHLILFSISDLGFRI